MGFKFKADFAISSFIVVGFPYISDYSTFVGAPGIGFIFAYAASSCSCSVIAFAGYYDWLDCPTVFVAAVSTLCRFLAAAASCSAIVSVLSTFVLDSCALIGPRPPGGAGGGLATRLSPFLGVGTLIGTEELGINLGVVDFGAGV